MRDNLVIWFNRLFRITGLLALLISLPIFAQEHHMEAADDAVQIHITLSDFAFVVEGLDADQPLELETGQVYQLHFTNESYSNLEHEVLLGKEVEVVSEGLVHGYTEGLLGDLPVLLTSQMGGEAFIINAAGLNQFKIATGQEMTVEFTLTEDKIGDWELGCFVFLSEQFSMDNPGPSHYDVGMHLPVVVTMGMDM
jgi:hypothetical protein